MTNREATNIPEFYRYRIEITDGGSQVRVLVRDPSRLTLFDPEGHIDLTVIPSEISELAVAVRNGSATLDQIERLGELLFAALFPSDIAQGFRSLIERVAADDSVLRLELDLSESELPHLAALPWEFLRAPQTSEWPAENLATHPSIVLSRRRRSWNVRLPIVLDEPLRIQLIVSSPRDEELAPVEYREVEAILEKLASEHPSQVAKPLPTAKNPDIATIDSILHERKPHVLHLIGHGRLKRGRGRKRGIQFGQIALVGKDDSAQWVEDKRFAELFEKNRAAVVLLQACETGALGSAQSFVGVASQVVQRNVPVVVAMQYKVSNTVATTFAEAFYSRLGALDPVDLAVQKARRTLRQQYPHSRDFATPVLFMRVADGQLFAPSNQATEKNQAQSPSPEWIERLPHPIATAYTRLSVASGRDEVEAMRWVVLNTVKYVTTIALSQYWQDNPDRRKLRSWFGRMSSSRLSSWLSILNDICDYYSRSGKSSCLNSILFDPYTEHLEDDSDIASAYRALERIHKRARTQERHVTPRAFLSELQSPEAPRGTGKDELDTAARKLLPSLRSAWKEILTVFGSLFRYPLYYIERVDLNQHGKAYTLVGFSGSTGEPVVVEPFVEQGVGTPSYATHRLYLCTPQGRPLLNLHPFLIAYLYQLYFLEPPEDKAEISYRDCASAERFHPAEDSQDFVPPWFGTGEDAPEIVDPILELERTNKQLENAENERRLKAMPLTVLLASLSPEGRQALEFALGESLRIGGFWLGLEFLLMGLSRQTGQVLPKLLQDMGIHPVEFRGALRSWLQMPTNDDWRAKDVAKLGAEALPRLTIVDPITLQQSFIRSQAPHVIATARSVTAIREAVRLAGEGRVEHSHLLLGALNQTGALPIRLFFRLAHKAGWSPQLVMERLFSLVGASHYDSGLRLV